MKYRYFVIKELIETEKQYIQNLDTLLKLIINPIKELGILNPKEFRVMFSEFNGIASLNKQFYEILIREFEKYYFYSKFSESLLKVIPFF